MSGQVIGLCMCFLGGAYQGYLAKRFRVPMWGALLISLPVSSITMRVCLEIFQ